MKSISSVTWSTPQQGRLRGGAKIYSSPPPGSGVIVTSILKIFEKFSEFVEPGGDSGLGLLEAFKFAFAQRSKLGDTFESPYECEIRKVRDDYNNRNLFIFYNIIIKKKEKYIFLNLDLGLQ